MCRGTSGPDGRERRKGPGTDLVRRPSERRWNERTRSAAEGRMLGLDLLVPFGAMPKGTRPAGRNPCSSQLNNQQRHAANSEPRPFGSSWGNAKRNPPSRAEPMPQPTRKSAAERSKPRTKTFRFLLVQYQKEPAQQGGTHASANSIISSCTQQTQSQDLSVPLGAIPKETRPAARNPCLSQLENQQRHMK